MSERACCLCDVQASGDVILSDAIEGCVDVTRVKVWTVSSAVLLMELLQRQFPHIERWHLTHQQTKVPDRSTQKAQGIASLQAILDSCGLLKKQHVLTGTNNESSASKSWYVKSLIDLGVMIINGFTTTQTSIGFLGSILQRLVQGSLRPGQWRIQSILHHMRVMAVGVTPIVAGICILMGMVLTFQSAHELRRFGAEIFAVDLVAIATMREIGVLLAAILVAGRSGSALTAQLGFMKLNQEIDALRVIGHNPIDILVIPRVLALTLAFPCVVVIGNMCVLCGSALAAFALLEINTAHFMGQLQQALTSWTVCVGLIKAPFFAFLIAIIGCYQGFYVQGGAEDVGRRTTRSVVLSIFWVVVADAIFSVILTYWGL